MDKCREAFERKGNIKIFVKLCMFDDLINEYSSDKLHDYTLGFVNGAWWAFREQQKRIDELNQENQKLVLSNTGYHNASASYLCKLMQIQSVLNQQTEIAKSKRTDGEVFEDKTETKIADYLDDYNIALDKILGDEATQEQFNAYAKGNEFLKQKARADKNQKRIDELQARLDAALKETQHALRYVEADMRGNHEFLQMAMIRTFKSLAQALKGGEV